MMTVRHGFFFTFLLLTGSLGAFAQVNGRVVDNHCGTMPRLQTMLSKNLAQKSKFETQRALFSQLLSQRSQVAEGALRTEAIISIPVVFHIVLNNPAAVTDAQVQAQLDTLNKGFFGSNSDSVKIPTYFKSLFGKSRIQFCLAQRTPDGDVTTGIVRTTVSQASFSVNDAVKHGSSGGDDSWNTNAYLNVWICALSNGILGYATFPDDGSPNEQGVVIDYRSLPGGGFASYNGGKTLTHETGHYFNLYHIWGDDDGLCTGTDYVDDTPNQADASSGNFSGVKYDACTTTGNGIMYQNYMDYSYDASLVMFTAQQVARMESALAIYRSSLLTSNGCQPAVRKAIDAQLRAISSPSQRLCTPAFTPVVTLRNNGSQTLTTISINTQIDNGPVTITAWTGSLATAASVNVTPTGLSTTTGNHTLTVFLSSPNGSSDEEPASDTLRIGFQYYEPVTTVNEGFEGSQFPPTGWDILNPDNSITWQRVTGIAKTGNACVKINNADYSATGQTDDLHMPQVSLPSNLDSAFFSFQVAAATFTSTTTADNSWDTLQVLISTDCGQTYTSLYKKWGASLVTTTTPSTSSFIPLASDWRKDSINLAPYIGQSNLLLAFRNTTGFENNIYLDDVNLRTVTINPNLKNSGFLVTPSPTSGQIAVQFYPQPANLRGIQVLNEVGQKVAEIRVGEGAANNLYNFDLSRFASGIYIVRAVFTDKVVVKRILKL